MSDNIEIVKEVLDMSKIPQDIQNDAFKRESWIADENGRIEREYEEKKSGINTEKQDQHEEHQEEQKTVFDFEEFKEYGDFKTVDELKEELKKAKENRASTEEITKIKQELEDTKSKLEAKPKTFFNNKELAKLDKLSKENPEAYERLARLRWGNMDSMSILKEKFIKENPEYKDSDIVEDMINRKYGLDQDYDADVPEEAKKIKIAKAELEIAAKAARKELLSELDNTELPQTEFIDEKKQKEDVEKLKKQLRSDWSDFAKGIEKEFQKFKLQIPQKDERGNVIKGKFIDFTDHIIPDDIRKACSEYAHEYVVEKGMNPTKENMQEAGIEMLKTYVFANLPFIIDTAIEKRASMDVEEFRKKYHNPSGGKKNEVKPAVNQTDGQKDMKKTEEAYIKGN